MEPTIDAICDAYLWLRRHRYISPMMQDGTPLDERDYDGPEDPPANEPLAREVLGVMVAAPNGLIAYQVVEAILGREVTLEEDQHIWMLTDAEPEGHA